MRQPTLQTSRLTLRPFKMADAPAVHRLLATREIAEMTANIPHPYEDGMAEEWILSHTSAREDDEGASFAITLRGEESLTPTLCGAMGISINAAHQHAELGYWIGVPYWNKGFATEAGIAVLHYAFAELNLNRVFASHYTKNPASGRVMQKIGMRYEGLQRQHRLKWENFEDLALYGILRDDWLAMQSISDEI